MLELDVLKKKLGIALSMRGKIASIALMLAVMCSFLSCEGKVISAPEDFVYELTEDGKGVKVTSVKKAEKTEKIIVPATIENMPVTEIDFDYHVESVVKESVKTIELPDTITSCTILDFKLLKSVHLPSSCKEIVFSGCSSLADIKLPDGITKFRLSRTALKEIHIPDGVTEIPDRAFEECTALETVNIPASVKKIDINAFYNCSALKNLNIDENIKSIYFRSFYNSYTGRDMVVFEGCTSLPLQTQQKLKSLGYKDKF